jgi:phosphate acetyltransferase
VDKITEALAMLKEIAPNIPADGEMQVDAAIVPEVAKIKCPESPLGGKANVLIFPDLEAGNIGYKLTQRLAQARPVGPLLLGLNKPASDLSRGCLVEEVVDCVAVTAVRAI